MANRVMVDGTVACMELTKGQRTIFDVDDLPIVTGRTWHAVANHSGGFYVSADDYGTTIYMHRVILGLIDRHMQVDHIDHDGLNNRRNNLRILNNQQNNQNRKGAYKSKNSTRVRGVCIDKRANATYYKARIMQHYMTVAQEYFPYTPEGLKDADEWAQKMRKLYFDYPEE